MIVATVPSSPPTLLDLLSGPSSSSPSIASVDTLSSASKRGSERDSPIRSSGDRGPDHGRASVMTSASDGSSASWGTAGLSTSSPGMQSLAVSLPDDAAESGMYVCLFHMLDCHGTFNDEFLWRTHVLSHFHTHLPPSTARCPLCPDTEFVDRESMIDIEDSNKESDEHTFTDKHPKSRSHSSAWNRMLDHVATDHFQHGQTLAGSRADFELMRYLYGLRIITDAQFKAMQLAPSTSSPAYDRLQDGVRASIGSSDEPYCAPYSRRREERMREQQRGVGVL